VNIVGVGYAEPEVNEAWAAAEGYAFELWTDRDRVLAESYGAVADFDPDSPLRHAYLLDAEGQAVLFYEGAVSVGPPASQVLADCQLLYGE